MERRSLFGACIAILMLAILGYAGWRTFSYPNADECYACNRPIHAHTRTVAVANGRPRLFCCPACALSQHQQAGNPIKVTQLTSFLNGKVLQPDNAYLVKGSDVNMCERTHQLIDENKMPADLHFDRCAPSMIAFAQQDEALEFMRQHGGEVVAFKEAAAAFMK